MNAKQFKEKLIILDACKEAIEWADGKTWKKVYETCHRGDWLMWLFVRTNPDDKRLHHLVAGHQANTVRHLMTDERSLNAVDISIAYGEGNATNEGLTAARAAARDAAWAARGAALAAAWAAAWDAGDAAWAAARAAWAAAWAARDAAGAANLQQTADIFRKYVSIEMINI